MRVKVLLLLLLALLSDLPRFPSCSNYYIFCENEASWLISLVLSVAINEASFSSS